MIKKLNLFRKENAQTMVEFALVFPILLLITYGLIEFGRMVFIYTVVTGAAREGARYGAAAGTVGGVPQYANCAEIRTAVRRTAFLTQISAITIKYDKGIDSSGNAIGPILDCDADVKGNPKLVDLGYRIKVSASAIYNPWIAFLGIKPFTITSYNARTIIMGLEIRGTPYP